MIDKEEEEDLLALEEENPPLPDEEMPVAEEKKPRFYLREEIKLGKDTVHDVVMKMSADKFVEGSEQSAVKANEMFQNWDEEEERVE